MQNILKTFIIIVCLASCAQAGNEDENSRQTTYKNNSISFSVPSAENQSSNISVNNAKHKLPVELTRLLNSYYPDWQMVEFSPTWLAGLQNPNKNLVWITGDFDNNSQRDFAVQVLLRDSVSVITFLKHNLSDSFIPYEIERGPLSKYENESLKSFYRLTLLHPTDSVYDGNINGYHKFPHDAILISTFNLEKVIYKTHHWQVKIIPGPTPFKKQ